MVVVSAIYIYVYYIDYGSQWSECLTLISDLNTSEVHVRVRLAQSKL